MTCGTRWGGLLSARPVWNIIPQYGSTLGGSAGAMYGVVYGVCTLGGGVTCVGDALVKISASCLSAAFCLYPNVVSGLVWVRLRREWVRSAAACVATSLEDSICKVIIARKNPWYMRLFLLLSWGCRTLGRGNVSSLA